MSNCFASAGSTNNNDEEQQRASMFDHARGAAWRNQPESLQASCMKLACSTLRNVSMHARLRFKVLPSHPHGSHRAPGLSAIALAQEAKNLSTLSKPASGHRSHALAGSSERIDEGALDQDSFAVVFSSASCFALNFCTAFPNPAG